MPRLLLTKMKILKVRLKNLISFSEYLPITLKPVMSKRFIKNRYTHIELQNVTYEANVGDGKVTIGERIPSGW